MIDHERFLVLASRELSEHLTEQEHGDLAAHLASCPDCRITVAALRRDDGLLKAMLAVAPIAPRVRRVVLDAAASRQRRDPRLALTFAAVLVVALAAIPLFAGGFGPAPPPSPVPTGSPTATATPGASPSSTATTSAAPSASSPIPSSGAVVATSLVGTYSYSVVEGPGRGVSIDARSDAAGAITGTWSIWAMPDGPPNTGTITCLVVRGADAYAFGPGSDGAPATFFWVHDGGPAGAGDRAISWLQDPGQPASELEGWCRDAAASYPYNFTPVTLTSGDIMVRTSAALPSPPLGPSVNGAYSYTVAPGVTRRDSIAAHLNGGPVGEWSRMIPATGGTSFGGPITCLVIDGADAWAAGPAATASDGSTGRSAYLHVRDGGPGGANDVALLWMNDQGQTLATMEGWCESRFDPAELYPLDDGDISIRAGTE